LSGEVKEDYFITSLQTGSADVALSYIGKIYRIESEARQKELSSDQLLALRREKTKPILTDFLGWLRKKATQVVPKSLLGVAVNYALGQWERLVVNLDYAEMTPDKNRAENAICPEHGGLSCDTADAATG